MQVIKSIQANPIFRYFSSVRMAIPLMLIMLVTCAFGTVVESRYESKVATLMVYRSWWFELLMGCLWLNILCATISRYPFKKHHLGFVITHIGLLTLLIGALVTSEVGIDGELRVEQGRSENQVYVGSNVVQIRDASGKLEKEIPIPKSLSPLSMGHLSSISRQMGLGVAVEGYAPFVAISTGVRADPNPEAGPAIQFRIKSQFFDTVEALQLRDRPQLQMGPATFRIIAGGQASVKKSTKAAKKPRAPASSSASIRVKDAQSGEVLATFSLADLKASPKKIKDVQVRFLSKMEDATVLNGKLVDQGTPGKNPAIALGITRQKEQVREISFARFPQFSLHPQGVFGLRFEYDAGTSTSELPAGHPDVSGSTEGETASMAPAGDLVEFSPVLKAGQASNQVHVRLAKAGQTILEKDAQVGEVIQTPWMGTTLAIQQWQPHAMLADDVKPVELQERSGVPPSALQLRDLSSPGSEPFWLIEGSSQRWQSNGTEREIYYGPKPMPLPFSVTLDQFSKVDYPGTETAMSYESHVRVNDTGSQIRIAMNDPLKRDGFTLYQSSYILEPGRTPISIFSVNRDPGRPIKYAGSLTLVLGIATFTLMRSHWFQNKKRKTA